MRIGVSTHNLLAALIAMAATLRLQSAPVLSFGLYAVALITVLAGLARAVERLQLERGSSCTSCHCRTSTGPSEATRDR